MVFFTICINNIVSSLSGCQVHLYADDTIVYYVADSRQLAIENLQLSFNALQDSLFKLKLIHNKNKTKFMLFSRARDIDPNNAIIMLRMVRILREFRSINILASGLIRN